MRVGEKLTSTKPRMPGGKGKMVLTLRNAVGRNCDKKTVFAVFLLQTQ